MKKVIFFDFDGVILDSMPIRDFGFRKILEEYPEDLVEKLIEYHQYNAGLSRFHKIKYFYTHFLNKTISEEKLNEYTTTFTRIMKEKLVSKEYLINETVSFIKNNHKKFIFHIVSGSEQNELRYLCEQLELTQYFKSIHGSPTHKNILVQDIINHSDYKAEECLLIGDSINDYEAAVHNNIEFYGFNNKDLKSKDKYITTFKDDYVF